MQKGNVLIFLLIGIVVLGAIGGAFYFGRSTSPKPSPIQMAASQAPQPTIASQPSSVPDETANWKTYTGKNYTFRYPSNWSDDISDQQYFETGVLIHTIDVKFSDFSNFQSGGLIYKWLLGEILPKSDFASIDEVFSKNLTAPKDMQFVSETTLIVDRQPAKEKIYKGTNGAAVYLVLQYPENKGYTWLVMNSALKDLQGNLNDLSQILYTFKFTQ